MSKKRVIVAMSGGVDSATAAGLLKREGCEVTGVTMKIWSGRPEPVVEPARHASYGPGEEQDITDAGEAAGILGIPFHVFDLSAEFEADVLGFVRDSYRAGRTPNPCVRCNVRMKFDLLARRAAEAGIPFDFLATGHYARVGPHPVHGCVLLRKAADLSKDQSYFLYGLERATLERCLFPLGELTKARVRELSRELGLSLAGKAESQNFVAAGYESLFPGELRAGPILNAAGEEIGRHRGIHCYTVGQRRGFGALGPRACYVLRIDPARNAVVVGDREALLRPGLTARDVVWHIPPPVTPVRVMARIRHSAREAQAAVLPAEAGTARVEFDVPQSAIAPGQSVVFYEGEYLIGGGIIVAGL